MTRTNFNEHEFVFSEEFEKTVGTIFRTLYLFSDNDIECFAGFYREVWLIKNKNQKLQTKRLELLVTLQKQNQNKIFEEKQKLFTQLAILEELTSSSPFRDSTESI